MTLVSTRHSASQFPLHPYKKRNLGPRHGFMLSTFHEEHLNRSQFVENSCRAFVGTLLGCTFFVPAEQMRAEPVVVRHTEGLVHGFLSLRTLEGSLLADGELIQFRWGDRVTSRLVFHFKDGSLHDETVIYSARGHFRLIHDHLVQKGSAFLHPIDVEIDVKKQEIRVRYTDEDRKDQLLAQHLDLPLDVSNGLVLTLMKNIPPDAPLTTVSMIAATPKPRLIKLLITPAGEEPFLTGNTARRAMHFVVKPEIGGVAGALASLVGKQPPDVHVWILGGDAPAFVRSEGPLAMGGPSWRIELVSPTWAPERTPTPPDRH